MGLSEFPHFLRYVKAAVDGDRWNNDLVVNSGSLLDVDEIQGLMLQIGSKSPAITPHMRRLVLPHMMRNSPMPRMINMEPYEFLTDADLLMTGLPPIHLEGTPRYTYLRKNGVCRPVALCIPKVLADHLFHGPTSPLQEDQTLEANLFQGINHPIEITRGILKSGRVWKLDLTEMAARYDAPGATGPPQEMLYPELDMLEILRPDMRCYWLHHQRHWIVDMIRAGELVVAPDVVLHANGRGLVTPMHRDTLSVDLLRQPAPEISAGLGAREMLVKEERANGPSFHDEKEIDGPFPVGDEILEALQQAPAMRCITWNRVQEILSTTPPAERTTKKLVDLLSSALHEEETQWQRLQQIEQSMVV